MSRSCGCLEQSAGVRASLTGVLNKVDPRHSVRCPVSAEMVNASSEVPTSTILGVAALAMLARRPCCPASRGPDRRDV